MSDLETIPMIVREAKTRHACHNPLPTDYTARVDAIKFALQTMPNDRMRDAVDVVKRATTIYEFLTNPPAGGSRAANGGVTS